VPFVIAHVRQQHVAHRICRRSWPTMSNPHRAAGTRSLARRRGPLRQCRPHGCGRNVFHPCEGGALLRAIYLATLVWPMSMPSLRSSPWILGAPHNGLAMLISRISRRISNGTVGRPQRCRDFQRQYNLKPPRYQRITVSGLHNRQRLDGIRRQTIQPNNDQAIHGTVGQSLRQVPSLDVKLMTKDQDLGFQRDPRPEQ
jgi:hypothetical protein